MMALKKPVTTDDRIHDVVEAFEKILRARFGSVSGMDSYEHDALLDVLERVSETERGYLLSILTKATAAICMSCDELQRLLKDYPYATSH